MQAEEFRKAFNIKPEMDLADVGSVIIKHIKIEMTNAQDKPDEEHIEKNSAYMKNVLRGFFSYAKEWAVIQKHLYADKTVHPEAARLREKAQSAFDSAERILTDYNLTYMELMRSIGFIAGELKKYATPIIGEKIKWNTADEQTIHKYYTDIRSMKDRQEYLRSALEIVKPIEEQIKLLENAISHQEGAQNVDSILRPIRSSLRMGDFSMARKKADNMTSDKKSFLRTSKTVSDDQKNMLALVHKIIKDIEQNADAITGTDRKLLLSASEIETAIASFNDDIAKNEAFIAKYCHPYIENQIRRVNHLREKMLIVGSVDGLITLYIRLIRGVAQPLGDMKAVREYESQVIENVMYLVTGQFQEISAIQERNEDMMKDFKYSLEAFESGIFDSVNDQKEIVT